MFGQLERLAPLQQSRYLIDQLLYPTESLVRSWLNPAGLYLLRSELLYSASRKGDVHAEQQPVNLKRGSPQMPWR
jgi:cell division inhibitor SulA